MLLIIADFFRVTLDELIGRVRPLEREERNMFFKKIREMSEDTDSSEILEAYDQILDKHPKDAYLLHGKALFLYSRYRNTRETEIATQLLFVSSNLRE